MKKECFDLIVVGSGPGGYIAAIKGAQRGKKVALVEKRFLGGTCLNVGCIPTKTLIAHAKVVKKIKHAADFGISTGAISIDFSKMKEHKDKVVSQIRKSLEGLIRANGVEIIRGAASFVSPQELKIEGEDEGVIQSEKIIIATGSDPLEISACPCDHQRVFNSSSILELNKLPESLIIIGGGYIGCEFASLYAELGVKVTLLEALPLLAAAQGKIVSESLNSSFKKQGITVQVGVTVTGIQVENNQVVVQIQGGDSIKGESVLVAVGRKVVSDGLGLEKIGIAVNERGAVIVNDKMESNIPGVYAIGDITGRAMLAHVASHEGIVAAMNATGGEAKMHYQAVPAVIFTLPEIAMVGLTLEQAIEKGYEVAEGRFPFRALGKSVASMETEGFAQVIIDKKTGQILGGLVIGEEASSLIAEVTVAMTNELTADCIVETIHAHPTLSEAWLEATWMALDMPLHLPPKQRKNR